MPENLYDKHYKCLLCQKEFATKKVRSNRVMVSKRDSDLCSHFRGVIPYYYEANVCPHCGFAFTESFAPLPAHEREKIGENYKSRYLPLGSPDLTGVRQEEDAILSFKLALGAGYTKEERPRLLAGICMRLAWLHRMAERTPEENQFLAAASRFFQAAYETQRDVADDAHFLHMLGDINLRLGNIEEARQWYSLLFRPGHAGYTFMSLARDTWASRPRGSQEEGK